jgi:hypothetical protein
MAMIHGIVIKCLSCIFDVDLGFINNILTLMVQ